MHTRRAVHTHRKNSHQDPENKKKKTSQKAKLRKAVEAEISGSPEIASKWVTKNIDNKQ